MPQATLVHGTPLMVDITPTRAFTGGDVQPVSSGVLIYHNDQVSGQLGAAGAGGAVYSIDKVSGVNTNFLNGVPIYWNTTVSGAVSAAALGPFLGTTMNATGVSDVKQLFRHDQTAP